MAEPNAQQPKCVAVGQHVTLGYCCGVFASGRVQGIHMNPLRFELAIFDWSICEPLQEAELNTEAAE